MVGAGGAVVGATGTEVDAGTLVGPGGTGVDAAATVGGTCVGGTIVGAICVGAATFGGTGVEAAAAVADAVVAVGGAIVAAAVDPGTDVGASCVAAGVVSRAPDTGVPTDVAAEPGVAVMPTARPPVGVAVAISAVAVGAGPVADPPALVATGVTVTLASAAIDVAVAADGVVITVAGVAITVAVTTNVAELVAVATAVAVGVAVGVGAGATKSISEELELVRPDASYAMTDARYERLATRAPSGMPTESCRPASMTISTPPPTGTRRTRYPATPTVGDADQLKRPVLAVYLRSAGGLGAGSVSTTLPHSVPALARSTMVLKGAPACGAVRKPRMTPWESVVRERSVDPLAQTKFVGAVQRRAP